MSVMIETDNLGRYFGDLKAVDGISFSAKRGEVLGFLGPNGAGKSTTMKMLTCFLTPSFGTARVAGFDILEQPTEVRKSLGYLPENAPLYGEMKVGEFLGFIGEIRGLQGSELQKAIERSIELTSLEEVVEQRIETLSKGFKRRVGLAQALLHDPEILILDEPTDGLDPNQKHEVRKLILGMASNKCILLSTHILEEVDVVCNRAVIIANGKMVADDTPEGLRKQSRLHGAVTVAFDGVDEAEATSALKSLGGVNKVETRIDNDGRKNFVLLSQSSEATVRALVAETEKRNWQFSVFQVEGGHLDDVFRDVTMGGEN